MKATGEFGPNVSDKLVYITKLYDEEMHVLVRSDVKDFKDLNEKVVNFGQAGSSADLSARLIFKMYVPRMRDAFLTHLRMLTYEEAIESGHGTKLKNDLLDKMRGAGIDTAARVLITDFVIQ